MGRPLIDLTGKRYNNLVVLNLDNERSTTQKHYWICKCDCGTIKSINGEQLKNGTIKACGYLKGKNQTKYLIQEPKLYKKWGHMKSRCYNPKDISFKNYGGRGIKVCDEWLDYNIFSKWAVDNGYSPDLELDRIDVDGDYSFSNCRFVTRTENARNKRETIRYLYDGKTLTLKEIAELKGIPYKIMWQQLKRAKAKDKLAEKLKELGIREVNK